MTEHTPLPWSLCNDGKCSCLTISCPDHPVAKVQSGKWGDDYPALRMVGGSIEGKFETYMEQITYGEISEDMARANARLIVKAVNNHDALVDLVKTLLENDPDYPIADNGMTVLDGWRERAKRVLGDVGSPGNG